MRPVACILVLAMTTLGAVEGPLIEPIPPKPAAPAAVAADADKPAAPAKPVAIEFSWEHYRSLVVVGEGVGQIRPAWVATYEAPTPTIPGLNLLNPILGIFGYHVDVAPPNEALAVAYRAQAYLDATGRLHLDARQAVISGPQADQWSPDSFIFTLPDKVETVDDNQSANAGVIDRVIDPLKDPAAYGSALGKVQVVVGDGI